MFDFLNLTIGSTGKIVAKLQGWLNELLKLKPPLDTNGFFDPKTGAAVRAFQQRNNIPVGHQPVVGVKTWKLIGRKLGERRIFDDPDVPPALKKIMAADIIAHPGALKIDKTVFRFLYRAQVRKDFVAKLNDDNLDLLLGFMEADPDLNDLRWLAYMLATALMECGPDFGPKSEHACNDTTGCVPLKDNPRTYGDPRICPNLLKKPAQPCPAGKKTHTYFGRGYAQLTHFGNYVKLSDKLNLGDRLVHFTELANDPPISYRIMSVGMREGLFTGAKLGDFISGAKCDYRSARAIINPGDQVTFALGNELATIFEEIFEASVIA
jgi:putative chitinase